jgi:hypothetical protein
MKYALLTVLLWTGWSACAQQKVPASDIQIKTALLAAPADKRAGATVYGYSAGKKFVLMRKGTNELVCLADNPDEPGFSVACYHRDLEPFMQRGRTLRQAENAQATYHLVCVFGERRRCRCGYRHRKKRRPSLRDLYTVCHGGKHWAAPKAGRSGHALDHGPRNAWRAYYDYTA